MSGLPAIDGGAFRAFFIYDVADTIDLTAIPELLGKSVAREPLRLRRQATAEFIQFTSPPLVAHLPAPAGHPEWDLRAKLFDYGVISLCLSVPLAGSWEGFAQRTRELRRDRRLAEAARTALYEVLAELATVLDDPHPPILEEYFIFEVERFAQRVTARTLMETHASNLARLVLGEEQPLDSSEQYDLLRVNFAYYEEELVVVGWETAFVYDRSGGARAVEDILEFANTQLVELRTYDAQLDAELDVLYKLEPASFWQRIAGRGVSRSASQLRFLIVDIRELLDRSSNALKFIGDAYFARLYRGTAARFGLDAWQRQIDDKLRTISEMYRFSQDRAQHARNDFLELIIILLIVIEVVIGFLTLRHVP